MISKMMRISVLLIACLAAALFWPASVDAATDADCRRAAQFFLGGLSEELRAKAQAPFEGEARKVWSYGLNNIAIMEPRLEGVTIGEMTEAQRKAAYRLIACGLSGQGYQKSASIMRLDDILAEKKFELIFGADDDTPIGSSFYWLAVFGDPWTEDPWSWQLEGHHLVLNFTFVNGIVAVTPAFFGADPSRVPDGAYAGWRILGGEVDRAFDFIEALSDEQREAAVLSPDLPRGLFTGPGQRDVVLEYEGLSAADLDGRQLAFLWRVIEEYVLSMNQQAAQEQVRQIEEDELDTLHFSWMGPTARGSAIYYRIHGPSLLIEFDNTLNNRSEAREPDPNHIHTVYRQPGNDFGDDLLRRHYETSPDHQDD